MEKEQTNIIDEGLFEKIMEEVSHKQLLEKRRMYYNLYMAQVDY